MSVDFEEFHHALYRQSADAHNEKERSGLVQERTKTKVEGREFGLSPSQDSLHPVREFLVGCGRESITNSMNGLNVGWILGLVFDLLPDAADVNINTALSDAAIIPPHAIE